MLSINNVCRGAAENSIEISQSTMTIVLLLESANAQKSFLSMMQEQIEHQQRNKRSFKLKQGHRSHSPLRSKIA